MKIMNTSRFNTHNFVLNGEAKDGVPPTGSVGPGESATLDINMEVEGAHLQALVASGDIAERAAKAVNAVPSADKTK